jgi:preprotein translocase subunit SecE
MNENINIKPTKNNADTVLWSIIGILIVIAIIADRYFNKVTLELRLVGWLALICALIFMGAKTEKGQRFWRFIKEARTEMRKVTWPTRQETTRTTLLIAGMVLVAALILWGIDSILLVVIGWLAG